ncbi:alpha/beta hydrolase [Curtobacterium luteum]|nr:alpha/beta hydrolase [Curtobacterium luteum]
MIEAVDATLEQAAVFPHDLAAQVETEEAKLWMNYRAPAAPPASWGVLHGDAARAGATRLADDLAGFRATRADGPTLNVVGHSYGTTTGADALHGTGVHVDNFVAVASAGIEGDVGGAKGIDADHVYAGQACPPRT